jgi:hypothetical protein
VTLLLFFGAQGAAYAPVARPGDRLTARQSDSLHDTSLTESRTTTSLSEEEE